MVAASLGRDTPTLRRSPLVTIRNRLRCTIVAAGCAAALTGALSAPASAAGLSGGKYQCYQFDPISGYLYWGYVKVSGTKYKITAGKGKYSVKGHTIKWKSGPLKRYKWTGKKISSKKFKIIGKADNIEINCNR
jgi:hypothetical protein